MPRSSADFTIGTLGVSTARMRSLLISLTLFLSRPVFADVARMRSARAIRIATTAIKPCSRSPSSAVQHWSWARRSWTACTPGATPPSASGSPLRREPLAALLESGLARAHPALVCQGFAAAPVAPRITSASRRRCERGRPSACRACPRSDPERCTRTT